MARKPADWKSRWGAYGRLRRKALIRIIDLEQRILLDRFAVLAKPIRVMILYGTVLAKEDGEVLFFDDLYGQDRRPERLLGLAPVGRAASLMTAK